MSKTGAESDHSAVEELCGAWSHFVRETPDSCGVTDEVEVHFHPQTPSSPRGFPSRSAHRRHRRTPHLPCLRTTWVMDRCSPKAVRYGRPIGFASHTQDLTTLLTWASQGRPHSGLQNQTPVTTHVVQRHGRREAFL